MMKEIAERASAEQFFGQSVYGRNGVLLDKSLSPTTEQDFPIIDLGSETKISTPDIVVRDVENDFAESYDTVQFTTPGMVYVAEIDTRLFEEWVGNPTNKRVLEIGPGTGRTTLPLATAVGESGRVYALDTAAKYLEVMRSKAARGGLQPERLKLGVADAQSISLEKLEDFTDSEPLDVVTLWFGPLALMPTDPEGVLTKAAELLKPNGKLLITTNSLDALAYRLPEKYLAEGGCPDLPLGYKPSIFTRRVLNVGGNPIGMRLKPEMVLPARYYDPNQLMLMLQSVGFKVDDVVGISRLTSLFPAEPNEENIASFIKVVSGVESLVESWKSKDPDGVWQACVETDRELSRTQDKIGQYTYPAYLARKAN